MPTTVAVVGNRSAAQRVVVGLMTELNWTVLAELLIGSLLKTTQIWFIIISVTP